MARSPFRPPGSLYDPRGFAVGRHAMDVLSSTHDVRLRQWRWYYGPHSRRDSYEPHAQLAGRFMTAMGTLDGYYPGDHKGCLCSVEPVFYRVGTREVVRTSVQEVV